MKNPSEPMKPPSIPFLDLAKQHEPILPKLEEALLRVARNNRFILGTEVKDFEEELARYLKVKHVIGVSSGTDALLMALMGLGIGPGDEVVTTPYSFISTATCIARLGAKPVFVDINPESYNIEAEAIEKALSPQTKAIIPVHLYGNPTPIRVGDVPVIEDAAQSVGSSTLQGLASCLSFFPSKNLGAMGDGGAVCVNDDDFAEKMRIMRAHGGKPKYYHRSIGGNFRLDAMQASVLRIKLPELDAWIGARRRNADNYRKLFEASPAAGKIRCPADTRAHTYNQFVIRTPERDQLREFLKEQGISTEVYYPVPFHLQECFSYLGYEKGDFPHAEQAAAETLALPIYPGLEPSQQERVVEQVTRYLRNGSSSGRTF